MKLLGKLLVLVGLIVGIVFIAMPKAAASSCTPIRLSKVIALSSGVVANVLYVEKCGKTMQILFVESATNGAPYTIKNVEIWRFTKPSENAVKSKNIPYNKYSTGHRINMMKEIPAISNGKQWSGYVKMTIVSRTDRVDQYFMF